MSKKKVQFDNTQTMSYETYAYIKYLLESKSKELEREFLIACRFIPLETPPYKGETGITKANRIHAKEHADIKRMLNELHVAAASTYKNHPNPAMRKFWGLE